MVDDLHEFHKARIFRKWTVLTILMIKFSFTFNGKSYQASATDVVSLNGDTLYDVELHDQAHQQYLTQPLLTRYKKGGYWWPSSSFVIETEFMKTAALGLIKQMEGK
jgi:hypothetical protein